MQFSHCYCLCICIGGVSIIRVPPPPIHLPVQPFHPYNSSLVSPPPHGPLHLSPSLVLQSRSLLTSLFIPYLPYPSHFSHFLSSLPSFYLDLYVSPFHVLPSRFIVFIRISLHSSHSLPVLTSSCSTDLCLSPFLFVYSHYPCTLVSHPNTIAS